MSDEPTKRHVVVVKRPATTQDANGIKDRDAAPTTLIAEWPCSIETLSGIEQIRARKMFADATHRVKGFVDPANPIRATDFLSFGSRTLYIGFVDNLEQKDLEYELLVAEQV